MLCTELKKVVISIAKLLYDIFMKGTSLQSEEIKKCVIAAATKLLKTGDYLQIPDSFDALKDVGLEFFYSNSKKALKIMDDFHQTIFVNVLILVVVTSVDKLLNIPELCEELKEMLQQWTKIGMSEFDWHADGSAAGGDMNINIIL
ncbi:uncharacterized protein F5147DRAFT_648199 [Suillus discolor]|uniref:Uncharacterized protein n=1 Tax=Suillus discolor TaxID=1912936 RepID=A0A9P7FKJ3_9AGAM|nr:uncharacterized protein F5147DRAFT_648199 [Suillus discolor]KAG2119148.1 hypothetical protein F5147DRAFT_648199 [Suillus discolor]